MAITRSINSKLHDKRKRNKEKKLYTIHKSQKEHVRYENTRFDPVYMCIILFNHWLIMPLNHRWQFPSISSRYTIEQKHYHVTRVRVPRFVLSYGHDFSFNKSMQWWKKQKNKKKQPTCNEKVFFLRIKEPSSTMLYIQGMIYIRGWTHRHTLKDASAVRNYIVTPRVFNLSGAPSPPSPFSFCFYQRFRLVLFLFRATASLHYFHPSQILWS